MAAWQPIVALCAVFLIAVSVWAGIQYGRRPSPSPARLTATLPTDPGFWCDLTTRGGMAEMSAVIAHLPDDAIDVLHACTQDKIAAVKDASTDIDRLFFLVSQERKKRVTRAGLAASTQEAKRILQAVLAAQATAAPLCPPERPSAPR